MKNKNQVNVEESEQDNNGINGTGNIQLNDEDKEKGSLKKFNLSKKTIKKLKARNVEYLYPIQTKTYKTIYEQNDCLIQASNGSGKTLAFVLPIVELLQNDESIELTSGRAPRVLVLTPTKDINKQISDDFQSIVNDLTVVSVYNAKKKADEQETAISNGCDILIATPDRLKELIDNEKVNLSEIKHFVIDEIDRMLDSDVVEDIKKVLKNAVISDQETKTQLIVFSETFPDSVRKLTKKFFSNDFVTINLGETTGEDETAGDDDDDEGFNESANTSNKTENGSLSLLTKQPNYTTYQLTTNEEIKGVGFVFATIRKCFGDDFDAKSTVSQIAFTKDFTSAVFDLPSGYDEQLQSAWKDTARTQLGPITVLPELDESSMSNSYSRGGGGSGGNRNAGGRSNGCFNCGKEGHKSFECTEAKGSQRNGGGRSGGGGGCFNCGKDGHKSFECPEPKKAGGGRGGGGERSNACFNCGKDGHKSFDCPEPKKSGGGRGGGGERSNACFNCGQEGHKSFECTEPKKAGGGGGQSNACFNCGKDGHKSFDCPEPKKGRPSAGGGGRGGRGGARGGGAKRSFGGNTESSYSTGEAVNKKIKFDDDDDE